MKQFTMHVATVGPSGPYTLKESGMGASFERTLDSLAVGESCRDVDGDTWTRLPDLGDEPQSADQARKERRERIATAAMAGILSHPGRRATVAEYASGAVALADALIAALDAAE